MLKFILFSSLMLTFPKVFGQSTDWIEGTWEVEFAIEHNGDTIYIPNNFNRTLRYFEKFCPECDSSFNSEFALAEYQMYQGREMHFNKKSFSFQVNANDGEYSIVNDTLYLDYKKEYDQYTIPVPFYLINPELKAIEFQWKEVTGDAFVRFMKKEE